MADRAAKHRIEVSVAAVPIGSIQPEFAPPANSRHQFDAQQVGQTEDGSRLTMGIGMNPYRVVIGQVFQEGIQNVRGLTSAAGDKAAEQGDVVIRYVPVSTANRYFVHHAGPA